MKRLQIMMMGKMMMMMIPIVKMLRLLKSTQVKH